MIDTQKIRDLALLDLVSPADVVKLCNELDEARKDSNRYKFLRSGWIYYFRHKSHDGLDDAIDAAIG